MDNVLIFTLYDSRKKPYEVWRQTQLMGMKTWADKHDVDLPGLGSWAPENLRAKPIDEVVTIDGDELMDEVMTLLSYCSGQMSQSFSVLSELRKPSIGNKKKPPTKLERAFRDSGFYFGMMSLLTGMAAYLMGETQSIEFLEMIPTEEDEDEEE